jgi:hypothetical protein
MSNCDFVAGSAGRSLIHLVASRLALRAPAPSAASALTRPNESAQGLSGDRHGVRRGLFRLLLGARASRRRTGGHKKARRMAEPGVGLGWRPAGVYGQRVLLLGRDALDDKCAGLRRAMPDRLDRVIGRRIIPGARFLHAVKSNQEPLFCPG